MSSRYLWIENDAWVQVEPEWIDPGRLSQYLKVILHRAQEYAESALSAMDYIMQTIDVADSMNLDIVDFADQVIDAIEYIDIDHETEDSV